MLSDKQCPHLTSMINEKGPLMRYGVNVHAKIEISNVFTCC